MFFWTVFTETICKRFYLQEIRFRNCKWNKKIEEEEGKVTKIRTIFLTIFALKTGAFKHFTRSMKMASNDQIQLTERIRSFLSVIFNKKTQYGKRDRVQWLFSEEEKRFMFLKVVYFDYCYIILKNLKNQIHENNQSS